jgi:hypothetical protein
VKVLAAGAIGVVGGSDFFHSSSWYLARNLAVFFVIVFWLAVGYWVYKDARRRIEDPFLIAMAVVVGLVPPFLGVFIYMLFRPPEYLEDVRERELEIRAMEQRLSGRESRCPVCRADIEPSFLVCPVCTTRVRQACISCKAPLEATWQVCPFCETRVGAEESAAPGLEPLGKLPLATSEPEPRAQPT